MEEIPTEVIVAIIAGLSGGLGGSWFLNRANATKSLTEAVNVLIKPLKERIDELETENNSNRVQIKQLERSLAQSQNEYSRLRDRLEKVEFENGILREQNERFRQKLKMPPLQLETIK